jgi:arylamine N-acetyltransferase
MDDFHVLMGHMTSINHHHINIDKEAKTSTTWYIRTKGGSNFFDSYDLDLEYKNNSSRHKMFMAIMETWETSSPGLENIGMDVS